MLNTSKEKMKAMDSDSLKEIYDILFLEERSSINSEYNKLVPKSTINAYDTVDFIKKFRLSNVAKYNRNIVCLEENIGLTNFHGKGKFSYDTVGYELYLLEFAAFNNNVVRKVYHTIRNEDGTWNMRETRFMETLYPSLEFCYIRRKIYPHIDEALTHGLKEIEELLQTLKSLYIKHIETLDKKLREKLADKNQKLSEEETATLIQMLRESLVRQINKLITEHSSRYNTTTITKL